MVIKYKSWLCDLEFQSYQTGNTALQLREHNGWELISTCTVNLFDLTDDEIAIKNYSENEGMYDVLLANGIIKPAHRYISSGFVNIPVCYLNFDPITV